MAIFDSSTLSLLGNILYVGIFVALFLYGQRIQLALMQRGIKGGILKLDRMQASARIRFIDSLKKFSYESRKGENTESGRHCTMG